MALHTFGTAASNSLNAVAFGPSSPTGGSVGVGQLSPADLAAISQGIAGDGNFGATPRGILATGSTHSNTTLDTLVATGGGPLAALRAGMFALGIGIPPGTFVAAVTSPTAVVLSQAATASASGVRIAFVNPGMGERFSFNGLLEIPSRGIVKVLPGDVVALDNTGWPIMVSANAVAYAGSEWVFT